MEFFDLLDQFYPDMIQGIAAGAAPQIAAAQPPGAAPGLPAGPVPEAAPPPTTPPAPSPAAGAGTDALAAGTQAGGGAKPFGMSPEAIKALMAAMSMGGGQPQRPMMAPVGARPAAGGQPIRPPIAMAGMPSMMPGQRRGY